METDEGTDEQQINMCCLGIYARACGIAVKRIREKCMPSLVGKLPKQMAWTLDTGDDSTMAERLATINDTTRFADVTKEKLIIAEFAKLGIKVRFVGKD